MSHTVSRYPTHAPWLGSAIMSTLGNANRSPGRAPGEFAPRVEQRGASDPGGLNTAPDIRPSGTNQPFGADAGLNPNMSRVLIPIDATERSRWALRHALAEHRAGRAIEAHLLFVAEPITSWQVLRFRMQSEIAQFQAQRAQWLLEDAAAPLQQAGVPVNGHFREGDIAFAILDAAEQLGCSRIILPPPRPRWLSLLARDIVRQVLQRANGHDVVTVNKAGLAQTACASR